jgi:hypothetical protein
MIDWTVGSDGILIARNGQSAFAVYDNNCGYTKKRVRYRKVGDDVVVEEVTIDQLNNFD